MKEKRPDDEAYIRSILAAIDNIALHRSRGSTDDDMLRKAVVYELLTIGEGCNKVSNALQQKYPEVEWPLVIAARNKMIHEYIAIDFDIAWDIVDNYLPGLRERLVIILRNEWNG